MKLKVILWASILGLLVFGCDGNFVSASDDIKIVNWNTQEFFDSQTDGIEYQEFQLAKNWNEEKYQTRLKRLCEVLCELNADIFVLEEIENEAIIHDISNQLIGKSWKQSELLSYAAFTKTPNTSIGIAILSHYPITNVKIHSLDIRTEETDQPSMRPILETTIEAGGKEITVFGNHWKSKSGGAEKSEVWRDWQERQLAELFQRRKSENENFAAVACGDFNRDASEFVLLEDLGVRNPWFNEDGDFSNAIGSYFYNGGWERIDNIFCFGDLELIDFSPRTGDGWSDENGKPIGYKVYNGNGYSDHLPVMATVKIN